MVHCDVGLRAIFRALRRLIQAKLKEICILNSKKDLSYDELCESIEQFIQLALQSQPDLQTIFTQDVRTQVKEIILLIITASGTEVSGFIDSTQALAQRKRDSKARDKILQLQQKAIRAQTDKFTEVQPNVV